MSRTATWMRAAELCGWRWSAAHSGFINEAERRADTKGGSWGDYLTTTTPEAACFISGLEDFTAASRKVAEERKQRHIAAEGTGPTNENPDGCYYCGRDHHSNDCMDETALAQAGEL